MFTLLKKCSALDQHRHDDAERREDGNRGSRDEACLDDAFNDISGAECRPDAAEREEEAEDGEE